MPEKNHIISPFDHSYPENLRLLPNPPGTLYTLGKFKPLDQLAVAVIGTRIMSPYGKKVTQKIVTDLVKHKVTIISGMARGIDTIAHWSAIKAGGRTIAVLGSGLDTVYPPENKALFHKIIQNGVVISQFPPHTKPLGKNFLLRNQIISGLAKAVLVIEGAKRSGTISTATHAANQGKEVFATPGSIFNPHSEAPHFLIKEGAHLATSAADILDMIL